MANDNENDKKINGCLPVIQTGGMHVLPNQSITIDDENAHLWLPVLSKSDPTNEFSFFTTRSAFVYYLRTAGLDYDEIAKRAHEDPTIAPNLPVVYGPQEVADDVSTHLNHLREEVIENVEHAFLLEIARFDKMLSALWPSILDGDTNAINAALKISERRSKMLGLDKPIQVSWQVEFANLLQSGEVSVEDAKEELGDELFGELVNYLEDRNVSLIDNVHNQTIKGAKEESEFYKDNYALSPGGRFLATNDNENENE